MTVMKPDYDISELKQITASSEIKANADTNKMHYDSMKDLAWGADETEAEIILSIFAVRYPGLMFDSLKSSFVKYQSGVEELVDILEDISIKKGNKR